MAKTKFTKTGEKTTCKTKVEAEKNWKTTKVKKVCNHYTLVHLLISQKNKTINCVQVGNLSNYPCAL